jgi:hypothetical protein
MAAQTIASLPFPSIALTERGPRNFGVEPVTAEDLIEK